MSDKEIIEIYKAIVKEQADLIETLNNLVRTYANELTMATIGKGAVQTQPIITINGESDEQ